MTALQEAQRRDQLDAEELGLTLAQIRNLRHNFKAFLTNKARVNILSRWVKGTKDELTAQARAKFIASLLEHELQR